MASFNIHLAIAKKYIEKNSGIIQNTKEFYRGTIAPDLVKDKSITHYTGTKPENRLIDHLTQKVCLNEFLKHENIESDYQKGIFLHLLTDYLFFNNFIDKTYLSNISYENFRKDLYYSYNVTNSYIETKYQIDTSEYLAEINANIAKTNKDANMTNEIRTNILSFTDLDKFIEYVSNINLENYKNKIIQADCNVLP